jgi:RND family efflux transporter MFP subunit
MKKFIFLGVSLLVLVAVVGWQVYERSQKEGTNRKQGWGGGSRNAPVAVEVEKVQLRDMRDRVILTGTLEPESRYLVASKVSGRLEKLFVEMGDEVEKGKVLARLDDAEAIQQTMMAGAALKTAESYLEASQEAFEQSEREYKRQKDLFSRGLITKIQQENAKSQYATRLANLKMARSSLLERISSLEAAKIRLSYTKIYVDWEGDTPKRIVGERFVDPGSLLNANTPILSILNIYNLTAVVYVTEMDYFKLRRGLSAEISVDSLPERKFSGTILRIAPFLRENSREARVEVLVPNPEGFLKPGMFVRVNVEIELRKKVAAVPFAAVINRKGKGIFLADNESSKVSFVKIKSGIIENDWMEIREPNIKGFVVTLGHHLLRDGSPIMIAEQGKAVSGSGLEGGGEGNGKWKGRKSGAEGKSQRKDGQEGAAKKGEWQGKKGVDKQKGNSKGSKGGEGAKENWKGKKANQESGTRDSQG